MTIVLTIIHIVVCFFLIIVVLLQSGKAADLAGAFGGMGSQTTFGPRGSATVLSKATTIAAALFMLTSLFLTVLTNRAGASSGSVLEKNKPQPVKSAPVTPGAPASKMPSINIGGPAQQGQQVPVAPAQGQAQQPAAPQAPAPAKK